MITSTNMSAAILELIRLRQADDFDPTAPLPAATIELIQQAAGRDPSTIVEGKLSPDLVAIIGQMEKLEEWKEEMCQCMYGDFKCRSWEPLFWDEYEWSRIHVIEADWLKVLEGEGSWGEKLDQMKKHEERIDREWEEGKVEREKDLNLFIACFEAPFLRTCALRAEELVMEEVEEERLRDAALKAQAVPFNPDDYGIDDDLDF